MISKPDADGRYPLSGREYGALKTIIAAVNSLETDELNSRCELCENALGDLNTAKYLLRKTMDALLETVPVKKLIAIRKEMGNTFCVLRTNPIGDVTNRTVYVDQPSMVRLMERAISMECFMCEKSAKECERCPLFRDLSACFPYELVEPGDTICPFAGVSKLQLED